MAWGDPFNKVRLSFVGGEECPACGKGRLCVHGDRKTQRDASVATCFESGCNAAFCARCGEQVEAVPGEPKKFTCTTCPA